MKSAEKNRELVETQLLEGFPPGSSKKKAPPPPIHYKKLVVPIRMRSVYWKYFGFPAGEDGNILTKEKIVCIMCKTQMIYNRNTSNLRMHLSSRHKNILQNIDITEGDKIRKPKKPKISRKVEGDVDFGNMSMMGMANQKNAGNKDVQVVVSEDVSETDISNIAIIFPNEELEYNGDRGSGACSSEMTDNILNFIVTDLMPPCVVDGKGFHNLISSLFNKTVMIPNEKKLLEDLIPNMYNTCREQVYSTIVSNCVTNVSLSIEEWENVDHVKFLSIYMNYLQNGEPRLFTRLLSTMYYNGTEEEDYWSQMIDRLLDEWSINANAITAVLVSFNIPELTAALQQKHFVMVPCSLFVLQNISDEIFRHPEVAIIVTKCRGIYKYIQETKINVHEVFANDPEDEDYDENDDYVMYYSSPRQWLSTFYLLRGMLRRRNVIQEIVNNFNLKIDDLLLTNSEWDQLKEIVNVFEPLKTIVITLFEEKTSLISLLRPLIWKVNNSSYEIGGTDSMLVQELKQCVKKVLNTIYIEENSDFLTQVATALDPRFKTIDHDDSFNFEDHLTTLLTNLIETEGTRAADEGSSEKSSSKKQSRLSGINVLFGNFQMRKLELSTEDKVKLEISHYMTENGALLEECPLEWWQHMNNKCPNLIRLAFKYHCIPATIILNGNLSIRDYLSFYRKRSLLKPNIIDSLLFLNSNKFLY